MTFSRAMAAGLLLRFVFTLSAVIAAIIAAAVFTSFYAGQLVMLSGITLLWTLLCFWYTPSFCRRFRGEITETAIRTFSGVLIHRQSVVPFAALRTIEVWAPPLHRFFGCRTIILRFAGGRAFLPLISEKTAHCLTALVEKHKEENG